MHSGVHELSQGIRPTAGGRLRWSRLLLSSLCHLFRLVVSLTLLESFFETVFWSLDLIRHDMSLYSSPPLERKTSSSQTNAQILEHADLSFCLITHHVLIPRRIPRQFDLYIVDGVAEW